MYNNLLKTEIDLKYKYSEYISSPYSYNLYAETLIRDFVTANSDLVDSLLDKNDYEQTAIAIKEIILQAILESYVEPNEEQLFAAEAYFLSNITKFLAQLISSEVLPQQEIMQYVREGNYYALDLFLRLITVASIDVEDILNQLFPKLDLN